MEDKVTPARIAAYAARLAKRVCDTALAAQPAVDAPALLTLTPVRQLNLLVLHRLMHRWKQETLRLRSPYFNYEAPEVQLALKAFMDTLSRHIRVERAALEPLVVDAVTDALGLAFEPAATYAQRFVSDDESGKPFTADALRTELKYVEVNKPLLEGFINSLPTTPLDRDSILRQLKVYGLTHFRELAPPDALLQQLNELEPVTLADLREPAGAKPAAAPVAAPAKPAEVPAAAAPAAAPVSTPSPMPAPTPAAQPRPAHRPLVAADAPATPLHEKLRQDKSNLNDQLRSKAAADGPGLAEVFESKAKVATIASGININQRIAFIGELFDHDRSSYEAAIQRLDALPNADEARALVSGELSTTYGWADKTDLVQKLLRLIDRKFA